MNRSVQQLKTGTYLSRLDWWQLGSNKKRKGSLSTKERKSTQIRMKLKEIDIAVSCTPKSNEKSRKEKNF
uniref:Uncharacterized protein n=1 Tax=Setaria viridis TaxID=4556 RepID=A0A4U6V692_SETVI|nr:hypothetical protein SEVIR_3G064300v2 [Setaria viridis]